MPASVAPEPPKSPSLKFITAVKSDAEFEEHVMSAPRSTLCVCDVYAKWCGPCIALGKRLTNLSSDYMDYDIKWLEVCADDVTKFAGTGLGSKPLIIMYRMGMEVGRMDKGANGNEVQRMLAKHCVDKK